MKIYQESSRVRDCRCWSKINREKEEESEEEVEDKDDDDITV